MRDILCLSTMDGGHFYGAGSLSFHRQNVETQIFDQPDYRSRLNFFDFQEYKNSMAETVKRMESKIAHMEEEILGMKEAITAAKEKGKSYRRKVPKLLSVS